MTENVLDRWRIALYGAAAIALAAFASSSLVLIRRPGASPTLAIVPSVVLGAMAIAARYPCRAFPLRRSRSSRVLLTHGVSAAIAGALWVGIWQAWLGFVDGLAIDTPLLFGIGVLLYLMAVALHYLLQEVDAAREAEQNALRYELLAREAELKAFKAQVDPHFLYNSLNAVASLCGTRPQDAREMSQLLADFFRLTVRLGGSDRITLAQEIDLVSRYLAVERVRFGPRLKIDVRVDDAAATAVVPPLILQPLVENAVRHGIASMVEGGTIAIDASSENGHVTIIVSNPADPDRARSAGEGVGLENVRGRLRAVFGPAAALRVEEAGGQYRVAMELPR